MVRDANHFDVHAKGKIHGLRTSQTAPGVEDEPEWWEARVSGSNAGMSGWVREPEEERLGLVATDGEDVRREVEALPKRGDDLGAGDPRTVASQGGNQRELL